MSKTKEEKHFSQNEVVKAIQETIDWRIEYYNSVANATNHQSIKDRNTAQADLFNQIKGEIFKKLEMI